MTEAERAQQLQEERLAQIIEDAWHEYKRFLECEAPKSERYPHHPRTTWRPIVVALGLRAEYLVAQSAGMPYHWEESDPRHPDGHLRIEGTQAYAGGWVAWPTQRVCELIREGWLVYSGDAANWGVETRRPDVNIEQVGHALAATLEAQFVSAERDAIFRAWQAREARRQGSWLHIPADPATVWDASMEAELQRRLQAYRRHPGHW